MSSRTRRLRMKQVRLKNIRDRLELETNVYFLESLKLQLRHDKDRRRLQKRIHRKKGWRDYTV